MKLTLSKTDDFDKFALYSTKEVFKPYVDRYILIPTNQNIIY
jgi:hypothetical protein